MAYLTLNDYLLKIQFRDLDQILSGMDSLRVSTERASITRIKSRLVQKYDVAAEFKDTKKFCSADAYNAGQLVYLDADTYTQKVYQPGELTLYSGNVYSCPGGIGVAEAFTASHWELVGARYAYFYVTQSVKIVAMMRYKFSTETGNLYPSGSVAGLGLGIDF